VLGELEEISGRVDAFVAGVIVEMGLGSPV
jgi:hypothetical protein